MLRTWLISAVASVRWAFFLLGLLLPASQAVGQETIENDDFELHSSYSENITFGTHGTEPEYTGKLILYSGASPLTGNLTLMRDSEIIFKNTLEGDMPVLLAGLSSALNLNESTLTMTCLDRAAASGSLLSVVLNGGYGDTAGKIVCGNSSTPLSQQIALVLGGAPTITSTKMNFELFGGGLYVANPAALSNSTSTFVAKKFSSLILPYCEGYTTTTVGAGFTYNVSAISPTVGTAVGGAVLLGNITDETHYQSQNADYNGSITYTNTNYQDISGNTWGHALLLAGSGAFTYADKAFHGSSDASTITDSVAIAGKYYSLSGTSNPCATLKVSSTNDISMLPLNIGFCGGTLDLSEAGTATGATSESIDFTGHNLAGIRIADATGQLYQGGGTIKVNAGKDVTLTLDGTKLKTDNGIIKITTEDGTESCNIHVVIDCRNGQVNPSNFGGLKLPDNATLEFINVQAGDSAATGNLSGNGTVDASNNALVVGSNVSTTQDTAFTGAITNATSLTKEGTGATYLGSGSSVSVNSATVKSGELAVESGASFTVAGTLSVQNGGSLSGDGIIQGNVLLDNGGWLCPGNSINTHTTAGNLTVNAGGGIQIQTVGLASGYVGQAGTDNDVERVGGKLTIQNGGRLLVTKDSSSVHPYTSGSKYYAVVAQDGIENITGLRVSDSISGVTVNDYGVEHTTVNVTGLGNITGDWLWFELIRGFHAMTPNGRNVSNCLVALNDADEMTTLYNAVDALSSDEQAVALQSLSGEPLATSQSIAMNAAMVKMNVLLNHIRPGAVNPSSSAYASQWGDSVLPLREVSLGNMPANCQWSGWFAGYGAGGSVGADGKTMTTGVNSAGAVFAIERKFGDENRFGFYYNYGHSGGSQADYNAYTNVDDHFFGAYMTRQVEPFYWLSTMGIGADSYDSRRLVSVGQINEVGRSNYSGWQTDIYNEFGVAVKARYLTYQPFAGLNYVYLRQTAWQKTLRLLRIRLCKATGPILMPSAPTWAAVFPAFSIVDRLLRQPSSGLPGFMNC